MITKENDMQIIKTEVGHQVTTPKGTAVVTRIENGQIYGIYLEGELAGSRNVAGGFNEFLLSETPAAACPRCGGWTAHGGMSQHSKSEEPVLGRTGCTC